MGSYLRCRFLLVGLLCACGTKGPTSVASPVSEERQEASARLTIGLEGVNPKVHGEFTGCRVESLSAPIDKESVTRVGAAAIIHSAWLESWAQRQCSDAISFESGITIMGEAFDVSESKILVGAVHQVTHGKTHLRFIGFDDEEVKQQERALSNPSVVGHFDIYNSDHAAGPGIVLRSRNLQDALVEHVVATEFSDSPHTQAAMLKLISATRSVLQEELSKNLERYRKHATQQEGVRAEGWDADTVELVNFCFEAEARSLGDVSPEQIVFNRMTPWLKRFRHLHSGQETTDFAACSRRLGRVLRVVEYHPSVISFSRTLGIELESTTVTSSKTNRFRKNDVIVSLNGRDVSTNAQLFDALVRVPVGARFSVKLLRGDEERLVRLRAPKVSGGPFQWYFFADSDT